MTAHLVTECPLNEVSLASRHRWAEELRQLAASLEQPTGDDLVIEINFYYQAEDMDLFAVKSLPVPRATHREMTIRWDGNAEAARRIARDKTAEIRVLGRKLYRELEVERRRATRVRRKK